MAAWLLLLLQSCRMRESAASAREGANARSACTFSTKRNGAYKPHLVMLSLHATAVKLSSPPAPFELRFERNAISPGNVTRSFTFIAAAALLIASHRCALAAACQFES